MKQKMINRVMSLLLALVCVMGILLLSAFAAEGLSTAPSAITQKDCDYFYNGSHPVRYKSASDTINAEGLPFVFNEQVDVPGYGTTRALCAYHNGSLGSAANGQKWNFKNEVNSPSLKALLTYVTACTYGDFTPAGEARGLQTWGPLWSDVWFVVSQAMTWYYEYGLIINCDTDREGFIRQASEEMLAAFKMFHDTWNSTAWITNWDNVDIYTIIDSNDNGVTGNSSYDYISTGINLVLDHPEYFHNYNLWEYEWDTTQPWKLVGHSSTEMQRLLIAIPDGTPKEEELSLTVKKLEAGTNKPLSGVTFSVKSADGSGDFSVTRTTGADGTFTLTDADGLASGQYTITEEAVPAGYVAQTASQTVTVLPNDTASSVFTFYNEPEHKEGDGSIRKVDSDNPTVGIPGAVIRITSVLLDDGGSFVSEYTTKDGGYILKSNLDFSKLPTGSYIAEEITPPQGYILSSDVSKVKQAFVWDGEHDISLVFENSSKVKVQLKKVDESGSPLPGAVFLVLRDGQIISTEETKADGTITVSNVSEGHYEFVEVSAPAGFDCDRTPVGVHVNAEDLQGEQTIVVTKVNHHKRDLTIQKRDAETGDPIPGTSFHVRGVNLGYENDVVTGADGKVTLPDMPSGCYEITETDVPKPYILDTNNRKTVWIDAEKDQDVVVDFVNSTLPGLRLLKLDRQTNKPIPGATFKIEEVDGGYTDQRQTDKNGMIFWENLRPGAYKVWEVTPAPNYVHDDTVHVAQLEPNHTTTIELTNIIKPTLKVLKVDSVTHSPIANVKFQIWRGSDDTITGELNDLGIYYTNASGEIVLEHIDTGWYRIKELEPAPGFTIKQPDTQDIYLKAGETHTVQFENVPKNAIVVEKYDSVTHAALPGCTFQLRYLVGTSGTGGTVIGQKVTGANGIAMWTGLEPGAYVVEEVDPADGYSIINSSETVFIADNGEQSVVTVRFDNMPDGNLLIRKVCATNPSVTLQNAEFKIMYADGRLIGDSNGIYRTDENGEIRIEGLEPGKSVIVTEVKAPAGFILDTQSQTIQIKEGRTVSLTFKNQPKGKLIIQKRDSQTNEVLPGAEFRITTAAGCEVGLDGLIGTSSLTSNGIFTTDSQGEIRISNLAPGAYVISEIKAPDGYVIDTPSTNVVIGTGGDTQTVIVKDTKKGGLIIEKYDSVTKQPLSGARFKVMLANGELTPDNEGLTSSNGLYTTDINGQIVLSKLLPGTYVVSEDMAPDNYRKDPTPQTVVVNVGDTQTIRFYDDPLCTLTILKRDAVTKKPLKGAEFLVTDSSGHVIGPNSGLYTTGTDGTVTVTGLAPNSTIIVSEKRAPSGYVLDETPKNIVVRSGVANSLIFDNEPGTTLIIRKFIEGTENEPLSGVAFRVVDGAGAAIGPDDGLYYTDKSGEIVLEGIEPGTTVIAREVKTVDGFVLDGTPQDIKIVGGRVQQLTFWNKRAGTLVIQKKDSVSGALISGAQFQLTYANGGYVDNDNGHLSSNGLYTTDDKGEIRISGIVGTVVVKEVKAAPGYVIDSSTQTQTVTVNPLDTQTLTFMNEPLCSLTITKLDSVTGKPVPDTQFAVKDGNGNVLATCTTGADGTATVTGLVPNSTVVVVETKVPSGYVLDPTPQTIIVRNGGNTVTSSSGSVTTTPGGTTGTNGGGNDLSFENDPKTTLVIEKYITGTTTPIKGVTFLVTDSSGSVVGSSNGEFITDENGRIVIEGLEPGVTITAREIRTLEGYVLDTTPKSIKIKVGEAQTLRFYNEKQGCIVIRKLDKQTNEPLVGVEFQLTYADGSYVDYDNGHMSSKGLYKTDSNGEIRISGVSGTLVITETKTLPGYVMDEGTKTQTVKVNPSDTQYITVYNTKIGGLTIIKKDEETGERIKGVQFEIRKLNGEIVGTYTTDTNGVISLPQADKGWYQVVELKAAAGYKLDATPHQIEVKDGQTATLEITNRQSGSALIHKVDSLTGEGIYGVTFLVSDAKGNPIGTYQSDNEGYVYIDKELADGKYTIREIECADGYILDTQPKTFYVQYGGCTTITWPNTAVRGQIQIVKKSADYNSVNGLPAGTPLAGATFEIYNERNGIKVDTIVTDKNGLASSKALPLGRYTIKETKAPANYGATNDTYTAVLEHSGQIVKLEITNKSVSTGVSIEKTGPKEAMRNQPVRYVFSGIGNTSNVTLESFYWRDTLPAEVKLDKIVTGTYNFPGNYKIVYKVNNTGEYRTLADNLSTSKNYTLAASPVALGLASNQRVTEIMFVFGQAPGGFSQVEQPMIYCTALSNLAPGSSFVNVADVGGTYNGVWLQAVTRWVTNVYGKPVVPTLPKTGY